jgi:hypothetical protein
VTALPDHPCRKLPGLDQLHDVRSSNSPRLPGLPAPPFPERRRPPGLDPVGSGRPETVGRHPAESRSTRAHRPPRPSVVATRLPAAAARAVAPLPSLGRSLHQRGSVVDAVRGGHRDSLSFRR